MASESNREAPPGVEIHYSPATVGRRLDVPADTVRSWIRAGDLQAVRFGRSIRIPESALRAFLASSQAAK